MHVPDCTVCVDHGDDLTLPFATALCIEMIASSFSESPQYGMHCAMLNLVDHTSSSVSKQHRCTVLRITS